MASFQVPSAALDPEANASTAPLVVLFERDDAIAVPLLSQLRMAGYDVRSARTPVELFDLLGKHLVSLVLVDLGNATAGRREFWVAMDAQRRGRAIQVMTFRYLRPGSLLDTDFEPSARALADVEVHGAHEFQLIVDGVRQRIALHTNQLGTSMSAPLGASMMPAGGVAQQMIPPIGAALGIPSPFMQAPITPAGGVAQQMIPPIGAALGIPSPFMQAPITPAGGVAQQMIPPIGAALGIPSPFMQAPPPPPSPAPMPGMGAPRVPNGAPLDPARFYAEAREQTMAAPAVGAGPFGGYAHPAQAAPEGPAWSAPPTQLSPAGPPMAPRLAGPGAGQSSPFAHPAAANPFAPGAEASPFAQPYSVNPFSGDSASNGQPASSTPSPFGMPGPGAAFSSPPLAEPVPRRHSPWDAEAPAGGMGTDFASPPPRENAGAAPWLPGANGQATPDYGGHPFDGFAADHLTWQPDTHGANGNGHHQQDSSRRHPPAPSAPISDVWTPPDADVEDDTGMAPELAYQPAADGPYPADAAWSASPPAVQADNYADDRDLLEETAPIPVLSSRLPAVHRFRPEDQALSTVLVEGALLTQQKMEALKGIQEMLTSVDMKFKLGELALLFKFLSPDQLLAALLVSRGLVSPQQIAGLGRVKQELAASGMDYDLQTLLTMFHILPADQLSALRAELA